LLIRFIVQNENTQLKSDAIKMHSYYLNLKHPISFVVSTTGRS